MATLSVRTLLPLMVVMVVFLLVLVCPGLGGDKDPSAARNTRIIFITQLLLGLCAAGVFVWSRKHYCTNDLWLGRGEGGVDGERHCVYLENERRGVTTFLTSQASVIAVYVFGTGSLLLLALDIYFQAQCIGFYEEMGEDEQRVSLLCSVTRAVLVMIEMPLLHYMARLTFAHARSLVAILSLLILIGANSAHFLFHYMTQSHLLGIFPSPTYNVTAALQDDLRNACLQNASSVMGVFAGTQADAALYPFYMLFCIVAIEILYRVYFLPTVRHPIIRQIPLPAQQHQTTIQTILNYANMQNICFVPTSFLRTDLNEDGDGAHEELDGPTYEENERRPLLDPAGASVQHCPIGRQPPAGQGDGGQGITINIQHPAELPTQDAPSAGYRFWGYSLRVFNPQTALIVTVVQATLTVAYLQQKDVGATYMSPDDFYGSCASPLILFSLLCDGVPVLLVEIYSCAVFSRFRALRHNPSSLRTVLYLSLSAVSIFFCFKLIGIAIALSHPAHMSAQAVAATFLSLLETLVYWPQYYLLTILLYLGLRRKPNPLHPLYPTLHGCFSYLATVMLLRFLLWCVLGVPYMTARVVLQHTDGWRYLVLLLAPLVMYFYYVTTFLLLRLRTLLTDQPPVTWQLHLGLTNMRPHLR
jgi:hypothetical protein